MKIFIRTNVFLTVTEGCIKKNQFGGARSVRRRYFANFSIRLLIFPQHYFAV